MYMALIREIETDDLIAGYLKKIEDVTDLIQKQIWFTQDYQHIGSGEPKWHKVSVMISGVAAGVDKKDVVIVQDVGDLEIFADSGFPKVFVNLIENALIHGKHVTRHSGSPISRQKTIWYFAARITVLVYRKSQKN